MNLANGNLKSSILARKFHTSHKIHGPQSDEKNPALTTTFISSNFCTLSCKDLCHPGPCAPCTASVSRTCPCGKTKRTLKCSADLPTCQETCDKVLSCGVHQCTQTCHTGDCNPCTAEIVLTCHCDKKTVKTMDCTQENNELLQLSGSKDR